MACCGISPRIVGVRSTRTCLQRVITYSICQTWQVEYLDTGRHGNGHGHRHTRPCTRTHAPHTHTQRSHFLASHVRLWAEKFVVLQSVSAAEELSSCQGFQGSMPDVIKEKMLELRCRWDHMLHRLAQVEDNAERVEILRIEKFMRDFLPHLRAGVRDQTSSDQLTQSIERLSGTMAQQLIRWNVMAMEPQKAFRTLLHLPKLRKIHEHELTSQGDFLGKGMFAVHKGWWQPSSSSSSLESDCSSRVPVAVKTYEDDSDDDDFGSAEDDKGVRASKLRKLFDRVEQNAKRQLACAHNN
eukprot:957516-Amphidinium_carterae.1